MHQTPDTVLLSKRVGTAADDPKSQSGVFTSFFSSINSRKAPVIGREQFVSHLMRCDAKNYAWYCAELQQERNSFLAAHNPVSIAAGGILNELLKSELAQEFHEVCNRLHVYLDFGSFLQTCG
jgi:hypothetical protein